MADQQHDTDAKTIGEELDDIAKKVAAQAERISALAAQIGDTKKKTGSGDSSDDDQRKRVADEFFNGRNA